MAFHGRNEDEIKPVTTNLTSSIADTESQGFDTQCSHPLPVNDASETQLVDYDGETQLMNLDDELQVMDIACETQECDDYDGIEHMDTQLLDDSGNEEFDCRDGEDKDSTEVLSETEHSTDTKSSGDQILGNEEMQTTVVSHQGEKESTAKEVSSANVPCCSGFENRGYAYIRTASFRTLGLEARNKVSKGAENGSCSKVTSNLSSETCVFEDDPLSTAEVSGQEHDVGKNKEKPNGLRDENKSRNGSKTARKLFMEEVTADTSDVDGAAELPQLLGCGNGLTGLSYVNSQELGESSQEKVLDFVERFLKLNAFDFDQDMNHRNAAGDKPNPAPGTKGTQILAKKADRRNTLAEMGIFNWDDSLEDEGGGEFFSKKKDVLFGAGFHVRKSYTVPQKHRHLDRKGDKSLEKSGNREQLLNLHGKINGLLHSDSKLVLHDNKRVDQHEGLHIKRNLNNDLDEQIHVDFSGGQVYAEMPDMFVGVDTQIASEAMEVLESSEDLAANGHSSVCRNDHYTKGTPKKQATKRGVLKQGTQKRVCPSGSRVITRSKRTNAIDVKSGEELTSSVTSRTHSLKVGKEVDIDISKAKTKANRSKLNMDSASNVNEWRAAEKIDLKINENSRVSLKTKCLQENLGIFEPIACRTRKRTMINHLNGVCDSSNNSREEVHSSSVCRGAREKRKNNTMGCDASDVFNSKDKTSKVTRVTYGINVYGLSSGGQNPNISNQVNGNGKIEGLSDGSIGPKLLGKSVARQKMSEHSVQNPIRGDNGLPARGTTLLQEHALPILPSRKSDPCVSPSAEEAVPCLTSDVSPGDVCKSSNATCTTPDICRTPINAASPLCIGSEYYKQSCKKNLSRSSLIKEIRSLTSTGLECTFDHKYLRKRRDMSSVRVLFSHHLDEDITRQQKKILGRLGASLASSISDATHFVADKFVRTRNMLEAIACGKPVVTHLWLKSCGQTSCFIDEKSFILRDTKKEAELGFSLPVTLAHASQYPLLKDRRVLITTSTKPGVEVISSLVRAVHGQAIQKICRSLFKDDKLPDDLLVLSCEEDYEVCMPLLEKGAAIYSSELLLNGIVTQKLQYERHRLFADCVKRTRSTVWLKKDGMQFLRITKRK
ncbi:hypothetical protein Nepgr_020637 [Nepenthes gracilis]|uniref:BRCT domain-containing protein n=1 Tax=Nepenthes gracilis TaxID=150966 RepID=A0AAD3XWK4_NEPGR|nr:hypothetical protein Nepgr_020637 [Nepenthes gracilis]